MGRVAAIASMALRRVATLAVVLLVLSFGVFALISLSPANAAATVAGPDATPQQVKIIAHVIGLDKPFLERYWLWLTHAVHGNLGYSYISQQSVVSLIDQHVPRTAFLSGLALLIAIAVGAPWGIAAGARRNGPVDRLLSLWSAAATAAPPFVVGVVLVVLVAVDRHWFPATGYAPLSAGVGVWLEHLFLPAVCLAAYPAAELARQVRASMVEALAADYVLTARSKGLTRRSVVLKHALKNAAVPPLTVLGFRVVVLVGSAMVVEQVFLLNGIGSLVVRSALGGDVVVVQGLVVYIAVFVTFVNLLTDMLSVYLDPRLRVRGI